MNMHEQTNHLAFVFPGQGSQSLGMLKDLAASHVEINHTFERASDALGKDLWAIVTNGPEETLNQTLNTQPIMLAAGFAVWEVWCKHSAIRPKWMAGHSLGEYTALVCSGALTFEDGIKLVAVRGQLMQDAVPLGIGSMAAILGLEDQQIVDICAQAAEHEVVSAVNFNAPGQVVIAGNLTAVERAIIAAKDAGAKRAILLPVSVPSHCELMKSAAEKLDTYLLNTVIAEPKMTVIHNADIASHHSPEQIRIALTQQLYKPVRWVESIKLLNEQGVTCFVECGPGKVLIGLNKRIAKDAEHFSIYNSETLIEVLEQFND
jgi:[acyl-carrier-protein] S-malonyltransferase